MLRTIFSRTSTKASKNLPKLSQTAESDASVFSRLSFSWIYPLIQRGSSVPLQLSDVPPLIPADQASYLGPIFHEAYRTVAVADVRRLQKDSERARETIKSFLLQNASTSGCLSTFTDWINKRVFSLPPSTSTRTCRSLFIVCGRIFCLGALSKPVWFTAAAAQAFAIGYLMKRLAQEGSSSPPSTSRWVLFPVVVAMGIASIIMSFSQHATFTNSVRAGLRARAALSSEIYRKLMRLSPSAFSALTSEGELGNLLVTDLQRVLECYTFFHFCWLGFIELVVIFALLCVEIGLSSLIGLLVVLVFFIPSQFCFAVLVARRRVLVTIAADARVQKMNEILSGIRLIKLSAWEIYFRDVIHRLRASEIVKLRYTALLRAVNAALFFVAPVVIALVTFASHTILFKRYLNPSVAFSTIGLYFIIGRILILMPIGWLYTSEALVSFRRFDKFFDLPELAHIPAQNRLDILCQFRSNYDIRDSTEQTRAAADTTNNTGIADSVDIATFHFESDVRASSTSLNGHTLLKISDLSLSYAHSPPIEKSEDRTILSKLNFTADQGDLLCIMGEVGSGKSTLLKGLLGELRCPSGNIWRRGRIAYCDQHPWIVSGTLRHNVTMFEHVDAPDGGNMSFDRLWYETVLERCCLLPDISILPDGDETIIGEKGITLSGGQKARIALARAVFSRADIYVLDDPLSAVDAAVAAHIVHNVLGTYGILQNQVRIVATHHVRLLPHATKIIVLDDGTIQYSGTFQTLTEQRELFKRLQGISSTENDPELEPGDGSSHVSDLKATFKSSKHQADGNLFVEGEEDAISEGFQGDLKLPSTERTSIEESCVSPVRADETCNGTTHSIPVSEGTENENESENVLKSSEFRNEAPQVHKELVAEDRKYGHVPVFVYMSYFKAGGGWASILLVVLLFTCAQAVRQMADVWVGRWSTGIPESLQSNTPAFVSENLYFLKVFGGLTIGAICLALLRAVWFAWVTMTASQKLHEQLLNRILHGKMSFFDTNPTGRILNRFSKDVDAMDMALPIALQDVLFIAFVVLGALFTISWVLPWFLIALVPIILLFSYFQTLYKRSSRELKRLDGITYSPIYSNLVETLTGLTSVRAFKFEDKFSTVFEDLVDKNHTTYRMFETAGRWLGVRLDYLTAFIVFCTGLVVIALGTKIDVGLAGVAITQSILLTGSLQWGMRQAAELENIFTSVERITTMARETPEEGPYESKDELGKDWPVEGVISFNNVVMRYRPELEPVFSGLSFNTRGRERIGIVGRTGSGKSSLFVSIFRMVELDSGTISIDGVDISRLGLRKLRSCLAIVPQDPVLFNGTIRSNLDPTGVMNDAALWDALKRVHIGGLKLSMGLDTEVHDKGNNFSAGERQLLTLGRAILSGAKIVVLDEASASLDNHTDMLIQKTVREQLSDRTVLTIAHRLATVADCDRVLVMDKGQVVEFDSPSNLMRIGGYFSRLIDETGTEGEKVLKAISERQLTR